MTTELTVINQAWYTNLIDDCKSIVVETEFTSRWSLVEGYHGLGKRILQEYENFQRLRMSDDSLVQHVAISISKKPRTVYYAIQFARMYPDLNLLKEGKNITWHHIINKYLADSKEKPVKLTPTEQIKAIKQLLQTELMKAKQQETGYNDMANSEYKCLEEFIRYLQDQIDKITGGEL